MIETCPRCYKDSPVAETDDVIAYLQKLKNRKGAAQEVVALLKGTLYADHPDIILAVKAEGATTHDIVCFDWENLCSNPEASRNSGCQNTVRRLVKELAMKNKKDRT